MFKAGQVLHDNDPRYRGRKVEVIRIEGSYAVCKCGPREMKVRLDLIFSDGMARRSGYSTVHVAAALHNVFLVAGELLR
jgi:hypothetical protein